MGMPHATQPGPTMKKPRPCIARPGFFIYPRGNISTRPGFRLQSGIFSRTSSVWHLQSGIFSLASSVWHHAHKATQLAAQFIFTRDAQCLTQAQHLAA